MALAEFVEVPIEQWDREAEMGEAEDRPLLVAYDIRDVLDRIQHGVDSANSALALKADKIDLEATRSQLHRRIDHTDERIGKIEIATARNAGWRAGFLVAVGAGGGLVTGLILHAAGVM